MVIVTSNWQKLNKYVPDKLSTALNYNYKLYNLHFMNNVFGLWQVNQ